MRTSCCRAWLSAPTSRAIVTTTDGFLVGRNGDSAFHAGDFYCGFIGEADGKKTGVCNRSPVTVDVFQVQLPVAWKNTSPLGRPRDQVLIAIRAPCRRRGQEGGEPLVLLLRRPLQLEGSTSAG